GLAAEALDAEALGVGVTPVLGGADALLRCHLGSILVWSRDRSGDARDRQPGQLLAVAPALLVAGLVLVAEDADLLATEVLDLLGGDLHLGEVRLRRGDLVTVDQQHGSEIDAVARLACHAVDHDGVTARHLLLTTACADDCVHHVTAPSVNRICSMCRTPSRVSPRTCDRQPPWCGRCGRRCPPGARLRRVCARGQLTI